MKQTNLVTSVLRWSTRLTAIWLCVVGQYIGQAAQQCASGGIQTAAGSVPLGDGGPSTAAILSSPQAVAVDGSGNVYVADTFGNRVRKVTPSGLITTVAGIGVSGSGGDGGLAIAAMLNYPVGLAVDSAGNLYIADVNNHRVRKVSVSGIITTVAGSGVEGYGGDGGPAVAAELNWPYSVAVDFAGNLYIADYYNYRIREVTSAGVILTVAGNGTSGYSGDGGPATSAEIGGVYGLAVDSSGSLYINDFDASRVRKVTSGVINTVVGNGTVGYCGDGGTAASACLKWSYGLAVDTAGNLYIADTSNSRVRKVSSGGIIRTVAGNGIGGYTGDGGPATSAELYGPFDVAVDVAGNLYIADPNPTGAEHIRKVTSAGIISTLAGTGQGAYGGDYGGDSGPATSARLNGPTGVAIDLAGNVYIADRSNNRVRKVTATGSISTVAGNGTAGFSGDDGPATSAELYSPSGVAVDMAGNLYIADTLNRRIRKVSGGIITTVAGNGNLAYSGDGGPATSASLFNPSAVVVDSVGNMFIADTSNFVVRKVTLAGIITTVAGNGVLGYSGDGGPATSAKLYYPVGVAVDLAGNLYIADSSNLRVRKVTPGGIITTVAGNGTGGISSGDGGPATSAVLSYPYGVAVDQSGNLYISDSLSYTIRRVTPAGIITTVVGNGKRGYAGDGGGATSAQLSLSRDFSFQPNGLAIDSSGSNLYIADTSNNRIRVAALNCAPELAAAFRDSSSGISVLRGSTGAVSAGGGLFASDPGVAQDGGGRMFVAARDTWGSLWLNVADPRSGVWNGWSPAGGTVQGTPAVALVDGPTAYIASRDEWNSYWLTSYTPGSGFGNWIYLAGIFSTDPAIAACTDGTVYVVGKDNWNSLWSGRYVPGLGFQGWRWGMGIVKGKPSVSCGGDGVVNVAVRDMWNSLWVARLSGNLWQGWTYGGGIMSTDPQIAVYTLFPTSPNWITEISVAVLDPGNGVWQGGFSPQVEGASIVWGFTGGVLKDVSPAAPGSFVALLGRDASDDIWSYTTQGWTSEGHPALAAGPLVATPK